MIVDAAALHFDEATHTYTLGGRVLRSVTQVIKDAGLGPDFSMVPEDALERKRRIGIACHQACALWNERDLDESSVDPLCVGYVNAYKRFLVESGFVPTGWEQRLTDAELGFAGTPDVWGPLLHARYIVIDLKNVATLDLRSIALQNAAYGRLLTVNDSVSAKAPRYALQLKPDGTYRLRESQHPMAWRVFLAALMECRGEGTADTAALISAWKEQTI